MDAEQVKELGEKLDTLGEAATKAQQIAEEASKKTGELDTHYKAAVEKASKDAADALQEHQELKAKIDAIEKTGEYMEKMISRMADSKGGEGPSELELKAREETALYLRTGQAMSQDVVEGVVKAMTKDAYIGIPEHQREHEVKTLLAGSNPDGGYFIRPERSATMIQRIFETSPMRNVANIETSNSDALEYLIDDDEAVSGGWVGEVTSRSETGTPQIGLLTIPLHEQYAQPKATQKMLDDAGFDIEAWLSGKTTRKMTRVENTAFILGDGSQKPQGVLVLPDRTSANVYQRHALEQVPSGASGAFKADGVKKLKNHLKEEYQAGAVFATSRENFEGIITLKDGTGAFLLNVNSLKEGDEQILLGKRIMFMHDIPEVAADSLSMMYGDFGVGYTIVDRLGFRVIRDNVTNKPNILFYTTKRTGAAVTNFESIKIQKLSVS